MGNSDLSVVCRSCSRKVGMEQVKFDDVRNAFVCESCFDATHRVSKPDSRSAVVDEAVKSVDSLKDSMVKYTCKKCNYHFARRKDKEVGVCPYCGSSELGVLSKDASSLVSDSDKF